MQIKDITDNFVTNTTGMSVVLKAPRDLKTYRINFSV